jgi:soluble lytic murein transglycosylase-like protein
MGVVACLTIACVHASVAAPGNAALRPLAVAPTVRTATLGTGFPDPPLARMERLLEIVDPGRDPAYRCELAETILDVAEREEIDPYLVAAVIDVESRFDPRARSHRGAVGLMQLLPSTAGDVQRELGMTSLSLADPTQNISAGAAYLGWLYGRMPNEYIVLTAYNVGPAATMRMLRRQGRVVAPYDNYATKVLTVRRRYRAGLEATLVADAGR